MKTIIGSLLLPAMTLSAQAEEGGAPKPPADNAVDTIEAKVLAVRADVGLVMLSVGTQQGVRPGYRFTITKDGKIAGEIVLNKVYPDMASGKIVVGDDIKVNDNAAGKIVEGDEIKVNDKATLSIARAPVIDPGILFDPGPHRRKADVDRHAQKSPDAKEKLVEDETVNEKKVAGTVLAARPDIGLVMISVGTTSKIKIGDKFVVTKDGNAKGKIRVKTVYEDMSAAETEATFTVEAGDSVERVKE